MGSSHVQFWYKERKSDHQLGGSLIHAAYTLTQSFGHLIGSSMVSCLGLAPLATAELAEELEPDLGLASLAVVEWHWSPSLFGMIISGHIGGYVAMGIDGL